MTSKFSFVLKELIHFNIIVGIDPVSKGTVWRAVRSVLGYSVEIETHHPKTSLRHVKSKIRFEQLSWKGCKIEIAAHANAGIDNEMLDSEERHVRHDLVLINKQ